MSNFDWSENSNDKARDLGYDYHKKLILDSISARITLGGGAMEIILKSFNDSHQDFTKMLATLNIQYEIPQDDSEYFRENFIDSYETAKHTVMKFIKMLC